jgi:branched-chain amino acid transport system permease protein
MDGGSPETLDNDLRTAVAPRKANSGTASRVADVIRRYRVPVVLVVLMLLPAITPSYASATNVLILTLAAAAFNLVFGYGGMLSLGHAAFYGIGGYACGLAITRWSHGWNYGLALAMGAGVLLALIVGTLAIRTRGIYFGMVTLALAECVHFVVFQASSITGGDNGLRGINVPSITLLTTTISLIQPVNKYYFILVFVGLALWLISRVLASPFGSALEAVRENETRAFACGIHVERVRLVAFLISGGLMGLAGALMAIHLATITPESLTYHMSGQILMMALLGGMGTFIGPLVGAGVFVTVEHVLSEYTSHWQLAVGALYILLVLFFPRGIWGSIVRWMRS